MTPNHDKAKEWAENAVIYSDIYEYQNLAQCYLDLAKKLEVARFYFKFLTEDKWANPQTLKYAGDDKDDPQTVGDICRLALKEIGKGNGQ